MTEPRKPLALFYHGLGGEPSYENDYRLMRKGYDVISEFHDYYLEWEYDHMEAFFEEELKKFDDNIDVVIGLSFGGYVAYRIAKIKNKPCVLINPALDRSKTRTPIKHVTINGEVRHEIPVEVFISIEDELIDPQITIDWLENNEEKAIVHVMDEGYGHNMPSGFFDLVIKRSEVLCTL